MISYHDVAFTFDQQYLSNLLVECKDLLQKLIARHLTDKSKARVENVFGFYGNGDRLAKLYNEPSYRSALAAREESGSKGGDGGGVGEGEGERRSSKERQSEWGTKGTQRNQK